MDLNTQLKPTVISNPHPLIGDGRVNYYEGFKAGETLGEYVKRVGVEIPKGSFVVIINGCVAMHDWRLYVLQEGDDIVFRSSALGGGGGGKVLRLVAMVALVAISAGYGAALGGALGLTGNMAAAVGGALIMTAGTLIVNAIFPPPKPQMPSLTDKERSPTYGISAGRNQANPYGPMLIVFGRHKVVPFLASKTYTTFDGDDQYLSQAFHFGLQPDLNLEKIRIGDTDITAYQDVQVEKSTDNGRLSLVSGNIDVLEGFEVYKSSGWVSRTTPNDTTHISIDIASNLFDIADNGDERTISVNLILQYKKTDSTTWLPLSSGGVSLSGSNPQKPTRLTLNQLVDKGQYDVRISKASDDISTARKSNKVTIAQIRCTQEDSADYTGQLRVAVKIKATSQLNGAIDELSAIASAKCPVWNGGAWEVKETSNPAWWFLWWARGKRDANFKRLYGECLPDNRIDIEAIKAWAAFCDRKNLTFNWVLDRKMSIEEVYYTIARAGRASTTWQTGKRGVIWDSDELPVTTLLTPANIIAGSFSYKHINTDVADEIIINYYDANKDWEKAVVRQKVPNATQANNPITLDLEGCTNESQAGREANLLAASQQLHRKQYSFEMDIEGAVLARGDVAQLTHDLTSFAAGGRLVAVNGNVLTLDADVGTATNAWLTLRSPFNKMYNVRVNANGNKLTLVNGWTFGDVGNVEDWLWQYDPSKIAGVKLQIKSVVPQSNGNIKFEAIEYSPAYFAAENNVYFAVPQKQARDLPAIYVFDALATERVLNEQNGDTEVTISWIMSELADASVVIRRGRDVLFNDNVHGSAVSVVAREGDTLDVEIVPFADRRTSRVFNKSFVVIGTNVVVPAPTGLKIIGAFTKSAVTIQWDRVINVVGYEVQVLSGSTVRRTVKVGDVLTYTYAFADMSQDGGAVRSLTFKVRALGQRSAKSSWVSVSGKNPQVAALQGIKVESNIKSLMFTCEKPQDEDFAGYLVWISDNKSFVPTLANVSHDGSFNQVFFNGFNGQPLEQKDYYIWCAGYDTFGKDELNISGYFVAQPAILKLDPQSIAAEMIQDGALTMTKFAQGIKPPRIVQELPATGELNDLVVLESTSTMYRWDGTAWNSRDVTPPDGSITNAKLANGAVTNASIANGAVSYTKLGNGAVRNNHLYNGAVTSTKLANGSVGNAHLQENSVGSNQLQVSSIVAEKIAAEAINNTHLQSGSVGANQLQVGSVVAEKIANNSVSAGHIRNGSIVAEKVATGAITTEKIVDNSIVANKIASAAVNNAHLANSAVTSAKIASGAVGGTQLANNAVTSVKIAGGAVDNSKLANNAVSAEKIIANAISNAHLQANSVGNAQLQNNAVGSSNLQNNAVGSAQLANSAVTLDKFYSGFAENLLNNPIFANPTNGVPSGWTLVDNLPKLNFIERSCHQDRDWGMQEGGYFPTENVLRYGHGVAGESTDRVTLSQEVPCQFSKWYMFSVYVGNHRCEYVGAKIDFLLIDGSVVSGAEEVYTGGYAFGGIASAKRLFCKVKAPSYAKKIIVSVFRGRTSTSSTSGFLFAGRPMLEECSEFTQEPSVWKNAGVTELHGGSLKDETVIANKIAANAVTAIKIASNAVTTDKLAANSVVSEKIATNSITSGHLQTNSVSANAIQAGAIGTNHLQAKSVGTNQLIAGSVTTDILSAKSVTSDKLVIKGTNLIPNSNFATGDLRDWSVRFGTFTVFENYDSPTHNMNTTKTSRYYVLWNSNTEATAGIMSFKDGFTGGDGYNGIPVSGGEKYYASIDLCRHGNNPTTDNSWAEIRVFGRRKGKGISGNDTAIATKRVLARNEIPFATWRTFDFSFTVPNDVTMIYVGVYFNNPTDGSIRAGIYFTNLTCYRMTDSNLIVNGAITSNHLQTGSVTTDKIASNSINTGHLQSNIINASHIQTGSITASKLSVMGDNLATDPNFEDLDGWVTFNPSKELEVIDGVRWLTTRVNKAPEKSNSKFLGYIYHPKWNQVRPGGTYFISVDVWIEEGAQLKVTAPIIQTYNNKTTSSSSNISVTPKSDVFAGEKLTVSAIVKTSVGYNFMRHLLHYFSTRSDNGAATGVIRIANPVIRAMADGELIVDGSITSDKIASNSIDTNHLKTNIINANHIQTGSITASKLAVMGDNLILDPYFEDINYWQTVYFRSLTKEIIDGKVWGKAVVDRTVSTAGGWAGAIEIKRTFDVKEGDEYLLSIDIWIEDGGQIRYNPPTIIFYKADNLSTAIWGGEVILDNNQYPLQAGQKYTIIKSIKVPSGCSKAKFYNSFSALTNQTTVTATIRYSNPTIRLRSSGELIVDGGIVSRHITTGAITTDHIQVGAVGGTQISNNAISTQHIQSNAIATNHIQVGAVGQTQIKPNSIGTPQLQAGSVVSSTIAAGAVGADQIAANSISAKHLIIGDLSNLVLNGNQQRGLEGYSSVSSDGLALSDPDSGSPTGKAVVFKARDHFWGDYFDVMPGAVYYFKFACFRHHEARQIGLGLQLLDKDNNIIGWPLGAIKRDSDNYDWGYYEGMVEIPSNAVKAKVFFQVAQGHNERVTQAYVTAIEVRRASHGTMIKDGSITTLKLKAGEIEGNVIKANTLNGDKIIGNSIHGDKITAGTIDANKLSVKELSAITSNLGSVTAGNLNINNRFLVDWWGNVNIKSGDTGARMVITNTRIEVYDSNNRLRVRMGIW